MITFVRLHGTNIQTCLYICKEIINIFIIKITNMLLPPDNQRIKDVIDFYCKGNELLFSREIGISQPRINRLFKIDPRSDKYPAPSYEIVQAIINKFVEVDPRWLLTGEGMPNFGNNDSKVDGKVVCDFPIEYGKTNSINKDDLEGNPNGNPNGNLTPFFMPNSGKTTGTNIIEVPVPVEDESEMVAIPVVDISVAAGSGFYNPDKLSEIDCIRMPRSMVKGGQPHLCVRIKGESMVPTLQDGGYLIIRLLDRSEWCDIHDGHVYVVSEVAGRAFVKRLKNRLSEHGFVVCMSDSADVQRYPNFNLMENELNTIWHAEWYISAKMPNIHATYYNKVSQLEDKYDDVVNQLQQISREIRALASNK